MLSKGNHVSAVKDACIGALSSVRMNVKIDNLAVRRSLPLAGEVGGRLRAGEP